MLKSTAFRFLASGAVNTLLTLALYWLLLLVLPPQVAYASSFVAGIALSYALNLRFVFRERHSTRKLALYPLIYLISYALGACVLYVAIHYWNVSASLAPLLSILCTVPVSFLLIRWLLSDKPVHSGTRASPTSSSRK